MQMWAFFSNLSSHSNTLPVNQMFVQSKVYCSMPLLNPVPFPTTMQMTQSRLVSIYCTRIWHRSLTSGKPWSSCTYWRWGSRRRKPRFHEDNHFGSRSPQSVGAHKRRTTSRDSIVGDSASSLFSRNGFSFC
jgi:hypothetical protein